jgi:hypothetical protein
METIKTFEKYPFWIVVLSSLVSLGIYTLGFLILIRPGLIFSLLYLIFIGVLEYRIIRYHCIDCYYWGKTCGFGKGRISAVFFKRGDESKFCEMDISWKSMIPDLLVTLIPLAVGLYLLIRGFNILLLFALILLIILTTYGNGFIRSRLTCKYCKQRELGCPAEKLFNAKSHS